MRYNFDEIISRKNTNAFKYDAREMIFGKAEVLPMWVADMDFKTPDFIVDALRVRLNHEILGYSMRPENFYHSLINWMKKRHSWNIEKDWISFSPGVVSACTMSVQAFTNISDSVIVQPPVYFPFFSIIKGSNRNLLYNQLILSEDRYVMDFNDLETKAKGGAKMIIISNPHNPVGRVWTVEELNRLADIALKYDMIILSDEIHSDLVFKPNKHIPLAKLSPEIAERVITAVSPSKTFNIAGLSTSALIISNPQLMKKYNKMLETMHLNMGNIFGNIAFAEAYEKGEEWLLQLLNYLEHNINYVTDYLQNNIPQIKLIKPESTYLLWLDCRNLNMTDDELITFFVERAGLGLNSGLMFGPGGTGFMRMNIALAFPVIKEAMKKLAFAIDTI